MNNWSKLLMSVGFVWAIGFFLRYFVIWIDYSNGIMFISLGFILIAFGWLYDQITYLKNRYEAIGEYLAEK